MLDTFRENAGMFVKFGQLIASMGVLFPQEYTQVMRNMFQDAPESDWDEVSRILGDALHGQAINDVFDHIEETPISSASMAQVHVGWLKNGKKVAVKVQHEWIQEEAFIDLHMLDLFVQTAYKFFPQVNYTWLPKNLKKVLPGEIDFRNEANNCRLCKKMFADNDHIKVPKVYEQYSSDKVIVMEFIEGINIDDVETLKKEKYNLREVSAILTDCFNQQIFKYGTVHADPHSGNIFVRKDPENAKTQVVLLDHGLYKYLTPKLRYAYSNLWMGFLKQDMTRITKAVKDIGLTEKDAAMFSCMVTHKDFDDLMDKSKANDPKSRLGAHSKEDLLHAKQRAEEYRQEISHCLSKMDQSLHMVFKVNNYLRTIDYKLGSPVNHYYYTVSPHPKKLL